MGKHTHIELTSEERTELEKLIRTGNAPVRTCMKPSNRKKPIVGQRVANGITRPNTAAGSTLPNANSQFSKGSAWTDRSQIWARSHVRSQPGRSVAIKRAVRSYGTSPLPMPPSNSGGCIRL